MTLTIELSERQVSLLWSQYNNQPPTDDHLAWAAANLIWGAVEKAAARFTPASTAIQQFREARALLPPTEISEPSPNGNF